MSEHVLSILVKAVGAGKVSKDLKGVDRAIANIGTTARTGLATAAGNLAKLGLVAGAGLGAMVKTGIDDLATLEDATTSVTGAIKQMGQTGQVTGAQVAGWANEIEANIGAAFDDKAITQATSTLIRFGSVTPKNLRKSMEVMTDLAAKTGDVDSAATLLAKALADPEKAAGRLTRSGVVLTKSQQDNIKALVKAGKTEKAQAVLLDIIATKTKGAAEASQGPYRRALSTLADVSEDARKALAEGFLPILERVSAFLQKKLADPKTMDDIRGFGKQLADAFSKVLDLAQRIPWGTIRDGLSIAGSGAKMILDAFVSLPPWVQTAVATGWGLNKLTGGAVSSIVGELGKGLIKGVLGINAGVVNVNGGIVNGAGGGVPASALKGEGLLASLGLTIPVLASLTLGVAAAAGLSGLLSDAIDKNGGIDKVGKDLTNKGVTLGTNATVTDPTRTGNQYFGGKGSALVVVGTKEAGKIADKVEDNTVRTVAASERAESLMTTEQQKQAAATRDVRDRIEANRIATQTGTAKTVAAQLAVRMATSAAGAAAALASSRAGYLAKAGGLAAAAAINAKDLSVRTNITNQVSIVARISSRENSTVQTTQKRAYSTLL